jgi:hypothetical protein
MRFFPLRAGGKDASAPTLADYKGYNAIYAFCVSLFLGVAFWQSCARIDIYPLEILLFLINGGLSIYGQTQAIKRQASIHYISFVFCYLFMAITPLIQLGVGFDPVFGMGSVVLEAALMALIFTASGLFYMRRIQIPMIVDAALASDARSSEPWYLPLFVLTAIVATMALVIFRDVLFTSRETFGNAQDVLFGNPQNGLLLTTILTSMPFFGAAIGLRSAWAGRRIVWVMLFGLLLMAAAVINNPLVHPRFQLAGLAFFFIDYMTRGKGMKLLALFLAVGIMLAPIFQAFRYDDNQNVNATSDVGSPFDETFLSYDYDSFQILCYTIVTVNQDGILWGENILGAALSVVPRAIWEGKPEQSSHMIYETMLGYRLVGTNNLSTPLMAEGYYAFWWFGAFFISVFYWAIISRIIITSRNNSDSFTFIFRCILAGLTLITMRGTLMVAVSAIEGSVFSAAVPWVAVGSRLIQNRRVGRTRL